MPDPHPWPGPAGGPDRSLRGGAHGAPQLSLYRPHLPRCTHPEEALPALSSLLKVAQVKEKFFGLRFYYDYSGEHREAIEGAVSLAEALSVCPEFALERGNR